MKKVTIEFAPDGTVKIEAHEFQGAECEKATKFIEDALGTVVETQRKPEYFKRVVGQTQKARQ